MTRFANVPGASTLASGRTGSIYGSAAEIGRELAEAWERHDRADHAELAAGRASQGTRKRRAHTLGAVVRDYGEKADFALDAWRSWSETLAAESRRFAGGQ